MIKYRCVHDYPPHKKGEVVDVAPRGSGNAFVPVKFPDPPVEQPTPPPKSRSQLAIKEHK